MENSTDQFVVQKNQTLGEITDYNAEAMTVVDYNDAYHLTQVPSRISSSWGRLLAKGALAAAATATVMTASTVENLSSSAINLARRRETLSSGVTVFGNNLQIQALDQITKKFPELWNDAGDFAVTPLGEELTIELPPAMKIHPVISKAHLEPAPNPANDPYSRPFSQAIVENPDLVPDKLLRKRTQRRRGGGELTEYLFRFRGRTVE